MPIKGMTDQPRAFVELGQLRKGAPKPKDGKKPGADLTYFRPTFNEGEEEAARMFFAEYGDEPRTIEAFLPFDEPGANFETWKEAYVAGGLIHRCDNEYIEYAIDHESGEVIIKNGKHVDTGEPVKCDGQPVAHWTDKEGKQQPVYCKPHGRLKIIVPQLRRLAFMTVLTTSIWDIVNLSKQLDGYWWENNQKLRGVRFILKRRPSMISTPSGRGGRKARRKKWLICIEPSPSWVEEQFLMREQAARPTLLLEPLELPPGVPDTNGNGEDEEIIEAEIGVSEEEDAPIGKSPGNIKGVAVGDAPADMDGFYEEAESRLGIAKPGAIQMITAFLETEHGGGATIKSYVSMAGSADAASYFWQILKDSLEPQQEEMPL